MNGVARVAISVLHYGSEEKTAAALKSLEKLDYPNFRIFVVDQTGRLGLKLAEGVMLITPERNLGFAGGHNLALERIKKEGFEYALLFNNDATAEPDLLERLVAVMERHPRAAAVSPTVVWPDGKVWFGGGEYLPHQGRTRHQNVGMDYARLMETEKGERAVSFVTFASPLFRLSDWDQIGALDDTYFMYWEDADWCVRARRAGNELYYEPRAVVTHAASSSLGVNSPRYLYYNFRNNLLFIQRYTRWYWKPTAWVIVKWQVGKELVKLVMRYRKDYGTYLGLMVRAYIDAIRGKGGPL